ncbi:MAG: phosphoribosylglycinamide formyltransferase [Verrucomicrobia bacterium]|nr:phosphoribosylglycinamide formyltransferase [Verrucomicrobiota bacterium]
MKRIGILGSGKGSNFAIIAEAAQTKTIPVEIALVLSDVPGAGILALAERRGIPCRFVAPGKFRTKLEPEVELEYARQLKEAGVELIILAGFMRILKAPFLSAFENRVMNIHPSLLPAFPGLEAWKQALEYGARYAGCTVHFVTPEMDAGPIIQQATVPILPDDTPETLHARIQQEEHRLYVEAIRLWCEGRLRIEGRRVRIL